MATVRFSLSTLIAAVVLISVYFAALRQSSTLWAQTALSLTVLLLAAGLLWAVFRPAADRAFWVGFQLCGWGYLLLAFSAWSQAQLSTSLITTRLAGALHAQMPSTHAQEVMVQWHGSWFPAEVLSRDGGRHFIRYTGYGPEWNEWVGPARLRGQFGLFVQIYHSLLALIMALVGGIVCVVFHSSNRSRLAFWIPFGFGFAALLVAGLSGIFSNSDLAASLSLSLLLALLFLATLAACSGHRDRASILGFAILGWSYFLLHFAPGLEISIGPHLLSTRLLNHIHEWLHPGPLSGSAQLYAYGYRTLPLTGVLYPTAPPTTSCILAGHALLAASVAVVGGLIAHCLSHRLANNAGAGLSKLTA